MDSSASGTQSGDGNNNFCSTSDKLHNLLAQSKSGSNSMPSSSMSGSKGHSNTILKQHLSNVGKPQLDVMQQENYKLSATTRCLLLYLLVLLNVCIFNVKAFAIVVGSNDTPKRSCSRDTSSKGGLNHRAGPPRSRHTRRCSFT